MKDNFKLMMLKDLEDLQNGKLDANNLHNSSKNIEEHIDKAYKMISEKANQCLFYGANEKMVSYAIRKGSMYAINNYIEQSHPTKTKTYILGIGVLDSLEQLVSNVKQIESSICMKDKFKLMMLKDLEDFQNGKLDANNLHNSPKDIEEHMDNAYEMISEKANQCLFCGANREMIEDAMLVGGVNARINYIEEYHSPKTKLYIASICVLDSLEQLMPISLW